MSNNFTVKDNLIENRVFLNRIMAAVVFIMLLTAGLVVRLMYLQIVGHDHYASLAKDNRVKIMPLPPTRGMIYDKNGKILAENIPSYSLEIVPEQTPNLDETLKSLRQLLAISDDKIDQFYKLRKRQKRFTSLPLLLNLTDEEITKFAVARPFFPGVDIHQRMDRHYPYKELTSHVVGYVGRINESELKSLPATEYQGSNLIGKIGIEGAYETQLHGKAGYAEMETNVQARPLNTINEVSPISGDNLSLTLDIDLQKIAYEALEKYNGAVVAIDIKTGGILVFASRPGYDPNPFVLGISSDAYQALQKSDDQPLYNRALRGLYPPGSTIKPFVGLGGLEHNSIGAQQKIYCPGYYQLPGVSHKYRDWKKTGHGSVNLSEAITQSCDVYFYRLALAMGIDNLQSFLKQFGFGVESGIDLVGEKAGLVPSPEWKHSRKSKGKQHSEPKAWFPGETVITGIGQGYLQVTPLQLAQATAILANRGQVITPHLVDKPDASTVVRKIDLKNSNINQVINGMINVVNSQRGTAKGLRRNGRYQIAGKTGTAQVFNIKQGAKYNEHSVAFKLRDHALFVSFAPANDPKIAVAVIAEHGGHGGSVAAPIAEKVIRQYLEDEL